jgi:4-amino-4-deoxy-L-arabinose transferase-like glycosyltransferase
MKLTGRTAFGAALFFVIAGFAYALTGTFEGGFPLLMVAAVGVALLGSYVVAAVRRAEREIAAGEHDEEPVEPHVGPTIWPFGYALSAIGVVLGLLVDKGLYVAGGMLFVAATFGWFADVRHQWRHAHEEPPEPGPPLGPDTTPMADEGVT